MYLKATIFYLANILLKVLAIFLAPVAALFIEKRRFRQEVRVSNTMFYVRYKNPPAFIWVNRKREFLKGAWALMATVDNPHDEYFWGNYHDNKWTVEQYENSAWLRYYCRVRWIWRNSFYGFRLKYMGFRLHEGYTKTESIKFGLQYTRWENLDGSKAFRFKGSWHYKPFNSINWGWKDLAGQKDLTYAARIFSLKGAD